jgi:hypothetical protein
MEKTNKNHIIFGLILILVGVSLLLNRLGICYFSAKTVFFNILLIIGAIFFFRGISRSDRKGIFSGTFLILIGSLYYLRKTGVLSFYYGIDILPFIIFAFGASFLILYLFKPRQLELLIPAFIFMFIGFGIFSHTSGYLDWFMWHNVWRLFLPVCLIFIGIIILLKSLI